MFKNTALKFSSLHNNPETFINLPRMSGICYLVEEFCLTDTSFIAHGVLKIRNEFNVKISLTYSSEINYINVNDEDDYSYSIHRLDQYVIRLDCQLMGRDTSDLIVSSAHPVLLETVQTSNFVEEMLNSCREAYAIEKSHNMYDEILRLFLDQPRLKVFLFHNGSVDCFEISTKPIYTAMLT